MRNLEIRKITSSELTDEIIHSLVDLEKQYIGILKDFLWDMYDVNAEGYEFPELSLKNKEYYQRVLCNPDVLLYIVTDKETQKTVGYAYAQVRHNYDDLVRPPVMEICEIVVDIGYRRKGMGKLLAERLERDARERNIRLIQLAVHEFNTIAKEFYVKRGFTTLMRKMIKKL